MNSSRSRRYFKNSGKPMQHPEDVSNSTDPKIDQDMPGFPHGPSSKEAIQPATAADKKAAAPDLTGKARKDSGKATDEERLK